MRFQQQTAGWFRVVAITCIPFAVSACATMYEGEAVSGEEPATIEGSYWGSLRYDRALIEAVDHKEFGFRPIASARILPGHHSVRAHCYHGWSHLAGAYGHDEELEFIAVSGHRYQVRCGYSGGVHGTQWTWIEDETGGQVVAGERPE